MKGDSLVIQQPATEWRGFVQSDSTLAFYERWNYNQDSALFLGKGFWFDDVVDYFRQRDSFGMQRHQAIERTDKFTTESLMVGLILFEVFLIGFLLKRGIKLIGQYSRMGFSTDSGKIYNDSPSQISYNNILWALTLIVIALMSQVLIQAPLGYNSGVFQAFYILRIVVYTFLFFNLHYFLCKLIGNLYFPSSLVYKWATHHKTTMFIYAMALTPVLIGAEINVLTNIHTMFWWSVGFLITTKLWLFFNMLRIFSVRGIGFFYFLLYLCALEILPIFLFYKGLFLL